MMNPKTINIIMADDHEIFRDGFGVMFRRSSDIKLLADNFRDVLEGRKLACLA